MSRRPRILLDVDGPLTDGFWSAACAVLREMGIDRAHVGAIDRWDIMEAFAVPKDTAAEAYRILRLPGVAEHFEPNTGAREFVAELQEWAEVYAVTSPLGGPAWAHERELWLAREVGIPAARVVSCRDKIVVVGDALVDDKLSTIETWSRAHPAGLAVFWRAMHNASDPWAGPSAKNYEEVRAYLGALKEAA